MKAFLLGLGAALALAPVAQAVVVHDEFNGDGDLSNDSLNPTPLNLSPGSNRIIGATEPGPNGSLTIGPDFFTVTIEPGEFLHEISLVEYIGTDTTGLNQSFFAVQTGTSIAESTILTNNPPLLGGALIGALPGASQGDNLLDDLGLSNINGVQGQTFVGFNPERLGPGTYTFWIQETVGNGIERYDLDFYVAVPEPMTILGTTAALGFGVFLNRKKKMAA
jgi:hypothetical protein